MSTVSRAGRALDLAGMLVFLAGAAIFARAWIGFRNVPAFEPGAGDPPMAAVQLADSFLRLQRVGVALMLCGAAVFVAAWWLERRRAQKPLEGGRHL